MMKVREVVNVKAVSCRDRCVVRKDGRGRAKKMRCLILLRHLFGRLVSRD